MTQDFNPSEPSRTRPENQEFDYALLEDALDDLIGERKSVREIENPCEFPEGSVPGSALGSPPGAGDCPRPDEWLRFASGEMNPQEADARMDHAAFCRTCAGRLRLALHMSDEQSSAEESAQLAGLETSLPEGRRRIAARLAATPRESRKRSRLPLWVGTGVAASLLIGALLVLWRQRANSPERLLAQAYSQARIFTLRMPGAEFSAVAPAAHL
ncbi:MAG: hypothetical protein WBE76_21025, partial [Terracidiphilus sp.]